MCIRDRVYVFDCFFENVKELIRGYVPFIQRYDPTVTTCTSKRFCLKETLVASYFLDLHIKDLPWINYVLSRIIRSYHCIIIIATQHFKIVCIIMRNYAKWCKLWKQGKRRMLRVPLFDKRSWQKMFFGGTSGTCRKKNVWKEQTHK